MKQGTKVVCVAQSGAVAVFSWGDFGDHKDRIRGHPLSVDAMAKFSEDAILTGSSDGNVRVVGVYHEKHGSRVVNFVGEHGSLPLERLAMSPDEGSFLSVSHGQPSVRVWSTDPVHKALASAPAADLDVKDSEEDSDSDAPRKKKRGKKMMKKGKRRKVSMQPGKSDASKSASNFFSGL